MRFKSSARSHTVQPGTLTLEQEGNWMLPRINSSVMGLGVMGLSLSLFLIQPIAASAQGTDTIRFGASLPLTGALATYGKRVKDGYDFYARHVNDLGGID